MTRITLFSLIIFLTQTSYAEKLTDETWGSSSHISVNEFPDGAALKHKKKMAVSGTLAGATGLFGVNMDINLAEDFAFSLGLGASRGFNAFNMHIKQAMGGKELLPYFVGGYSRWSSSGHSGGLHDSSPSVLTDKFLTAQQKRSGEFAKNIIYPGLGIQFINLDGDWQGAGFFAEVMMLFDVDDFKAGITGGLGTIFYF